jgi:hypothetical protein
MYAEVSAVRYPISTVLCIAAMGTIAALFVFARPQYHETSPGKTIDLSGYAPPSHDWTWQGGQPGFRFGEKEEDWNIAQLRPQELGPLRAAAARAGVVPESVRPLEVERYAPHRLSLIAAGTGSSGGTCLGFALPQSEGSFFCPDRLARKAAFVLTVPYGPPDGVFLSGIARADVTSVVVHEAGTPPSRVYSRSESGAWGTFFVTLGSGPVKNAAGAVIARPRGGLIDFFAGDKRVASLPVTFAAAREQLSAVAG